MSVPSTQIGSGFIPAVSGSGGGMSAGSALGGAASGAAAGALGGPVGALIGGGIGAVASIFGAKKQASAVDNATKAQADYNNKALAAAQEQRDYQRTAQNQYLSRLAPYATQTQPALATLSGLLQPSQIGMSGGNPYMPPTAPQAAPTAQPAPFAQPAALGGMVTMRAPNGMTKQVPANQVAHYQQLRASVVS